MSDSVPSKSKNTAGRRAASPSIRPSACNASGSWDIRRSPVRTVTSRRSATTASAPLWRSASRCPVRSTPITRANPRVARGLDDRRRRSRRRRSGPVAPPAGRPARSGARGHRAVDKRGADTDLLQLPDQGHPGLRVGATASSANSTASWRRGSMMTGSNLTTTNLLTVVNVAHAGPGTGQRRAGVVSADGWRRCAPRRARATNACGGPW